MILLLPFYMVVLCTVCSQAVINCRVCENRIPLRLLNILPFPNDRPNSGWDGAYELIPAAQLAVEHINNATDVLPGYKLEVVTVKSESCGLSLITEGLVNSFSLVFDPKGSLNVVGLTGLFCSSVTDVIAPTFSFPKATYLQVAGSTTPGHRDRAKFPWLLHLLSSSTIYNDVVIGMMNTFGWRNIALIYDPIPILFSSIANDLASRNSSTINMDFVLLTSNVHNDVNNLLHLSKRIVYLSATLPKTVKFMCRAYQNQLFYPGFVYIIPSKSLTDFTLSAERYSDCNKDHILAVLEGAFMVDYKLSNEEASVLVSNLTYAAYYQEYLVQLRKLESTLGNVTLDGSNLYSNTMYDELWAFALALNASLGEIKSQNINIEDLPVSQSERFATIVRKNFFNISFHGASGDIYFDQSGADISAINVYQVMNGSLEIIGVYDERISHKVILNNKSISPPSDQFEIVQFLLPWWTVLLVTCVITFCIAITTFLLIFMLVFRKRPEIKATSPYLNLLIFFGCYMLFIAAEVRTLLRSFEVTNEILFIFCCNAEIWLGFLGVTLIFATLLVRLLRIRTIFRAYRKVSKYCGNGYLLALVILISSGLVLILVLWISTDPIRKMTVETYMSNERPPYFESKSECDSKKLGLWMTVAYSYFGIVIFIDIVLALQTRKIRLRNFKDTKKINAYIFCTVLTFCALVPLSMIFDTQFNFDLASHITTFISLVIIGVSCQLFIFVPQVINTLHNMRSKSADRETRETQFTKTDN